MEKNNELNLFPLASTALLVAISIVLGRFMIYIPLFGFPALRFSMTHIPIFVAGALFGPLYGAAAGFLSDIINFLLGAGGEAPYHVGFTINAVLVGLISGAFFLRMKNRKIQQSYFVINSIFSVLVLIGAALYINFIGVKELDTVQVIFGLETPYFVTAFMIILVIALSSINYVIQKKFADKDSIYAIDKIIFVNIVIYAIVQLVLTPIWLKDMYGIPITASVTARIFKCLIDVPLQVGLIYIILKAVPYKIKGKYLCKA